MKKLAFERKMIIRLAIETYWNDWVKNVKDKMYYSLVYKSRSNWNEPN